MCEGRAAPASPPYPRAPLCAPHTDVVCSRGGGGGGIVGRAARRGQWRRQRGRILFTRAAVPCARSARLLVAHGRVSHFVHAAQRGAGCDRAPSLARVQRRRRVPNLPQSNSSRVSPRARPRALPPPAPAFHAVAYACTCAALQAAGVRRRRGKPRGGPYIARCSMGRPPAARSRGGGGAARCPQEIDCAHGRGQVRAPPYPPRARARPRLR